MNRKPNKLSVIIAAIALASVLAYTLSRSDVTGDNTVTIERAAVEPETEAPTAWKPDVPKASPVAQTASAEVKSTPATHSDETATAPLKRLVEAMPTLENYREEAKANPHGTPESVIHFSYLLTQKSESLKSEADAYAFFNELEDCMSAKEAPTSALALCLRHAQSVSSKYKALGGKYERLESSAPSRVRDIVSVL